MQNTNKKPTLLIMTGFSCNNNCIICSVKTKGRNYSDRSYDDIKEDLTSGRENGFDRVEFTGGEPAIRKDIVRLVALAKDLGYREIGIGTNGRIFSYMSFYEKMVGAGLNKVVVTLFGSKPEVHNAITRTPGSFDETVRALSNLGRSDRMRISISTPVSRMNLHNLEELSDLIISLGFRVWYVLDLIPDSNASKHYKNLVVPIPDLAKALNSIKKLERFSEVAFFDFPLCIFNNNLGKQNNVCFINSRRRQETAHQVGYNPERISVNKDGAYADAYKVYLDVCRACEYYRECGGVWREYLKLYGDGEIKALAEKYISRPVAVSR